MNKPATRKIVALLLTLCIITACNIPINITRDKTGKETEGTTSDAPFSLGGEAETTEASKEIDPNPIGIQEGLASFDSYSITLYMNLSDSTGSKTEINETVERSIVDKSVHSMATTVSYNPEEDTEESSDTTEIYSIGTETCTKSGDEWTYESITEQDREMREIFTGMADFIPLIDNPEFVGEETMNGIECNHFTFQVSGIGETSGSIATVNSGEYWLAKDGQYIVKYHLVLEIQSAAEGTADAEVSNIETLVDLTSVNQPVLFSLPTDCQPQQ